MLLFYSISYFLTKYRSFYNCRSCCRASFFKIQVPCSCMTALFHPGKCEDQHIGILIFIELPRRQILWRNVFCITKQCVKIRKHNRGINRTLFLISIILPRFINLCPFLLWDRIHQSIDNIFQMLHHLIRSRMLRKCKRQCMI